MWKIFVNHACKDSPSINLKLFLFNCYLPGTSTGSTGSNEPAPSMASGHVVNNGPRTDIPTSGNNTIDVTSPRFEVGSPKSQADLPSPSYKKSLFKKGNEDGRDKYVPFDNFFFL